MCASSQRRFFLSVEWDKVESIFRLVRESSWIVLLLFYICRASLFRVWEKQWQRNASSMSLMHLRSSFTKIHEISHLCGREFGFFFFSFLYKQNKREWTNVRSRAYDASKYRNDWRQIGRVCTREKNANSDAEYWGEGGGRGRNRYLFTCPYDFLQVIFRR